MYPSLLFCVWVLDEDELGLGANAGDICELDVVTNALAVMFEVETGVLEGAGEFDDGLSDVLDLFRGRDL